MASRKPTGPWWQRIGPREVLRELLQRGAFRYLPAMPEPCEEPGRRGELGLYGAAFRRRLVLRCSAYLFEWVFDLMNRKNTEQLARRRARHLAYAKEAEAHGDVEDAERARAEVKAIAPRPGIVAWKTAPGRYVPSRPMQDSEKRRFREGDPELLKLLSKTMRYVDRKNPQIPDSQHAWFGLIPSRLAKDGPAQRMIDSHPRTQFALDLAAMLVAEGMKRREAERFAVPAILKALREAYPRLLPQRGFSEVEKRLQRVLRDHVTIYRLNGKKVSRNILLRRHARMLTSQGSRFFSSCRLWQSFVDRTRRAPGR